MNVCTCAHSANDHYEQIGGCQIRGCGCAASSADARVRLQRIDVAPAAVSTPEGLVDEIVRKIATARAEGRIPKLDASLPEPRYSAMIGVGTWEDDRRCTHETPAQERRCTREIGHGGFHQTVAELRAARRATHEAWGKAMTVPPSAVAFEAAYVAMLAADQAVMVHGAECPACSAEDGFPEVDCEQARALDEQARAASRAFQAAGDASFAAWKARERRERLP